MTVSELDVIDDLKLEIKKHFHETGTQSMTLHQIINLIRRFIEEREQKK